MVAGLTQRDSDVAIVMFLYCIAYYATSIPYSCIFSSSAAFYHDSQGPEMDEAGGATSLSTTAPTADQYRDTYYMCILRPHVDTPVGIR